MKQELFHVSTWNTNIIFSNTNFIFEHEFYFFEHELNELNEFFIKTCDSKIIRVIRIIRVQKNISGLYMLGVVL